MEGHVAWIIELGVKDGQLDTFRELMEEMCDGTGAEPQTLAYEWYISDDGGAVHIFEKYADSDAMITHVNGFLEKWARRFMGCRRRARQGPWGGWCARQGRWWRHRHR